MPVFPSGSVGIPPAPFNASNAAHTSSVLPGANAPGVPPAPGKGVLFLSPDPEFDENGLCVVPLAPELIASAQILVNPNGVQSGVSIHSTTASSVTFRADAGELAEGASLRVSYKSS